MRRLDGWEQILEEKERSLSGQTSLLHFFRSYQGHGRGHLLGIGYDDADHPPTAQELVQPT